MTQTGVSIKLTEEQKEKLDRLWKSSGAKSRSAFIKSRIGITNGITDRILHDKADNFEFLKSLFENSKVKVYDSKMTPEELTRLQKL